MTDPTQTADPTVPSNPIVATPGVSRTVLATVSSAVLIVAGAIPTITAVVGTHSVVKIATYINSVEFAPVGGAILLLGTLGVRLWTQIQKHTDFVTLARAVKNAVGYVKGDPGTPTTPGSTIVLPPK